MSAQDDFGSSILEFFRDDPLTVTYVQTTGGTQNYETGEYVPTVVETPCKAIMLDLTRNMSGFSTKFGILVSQGDKEVYILPPEREDSYGTPLVITPGTDKLVAGSITYTVVAMTEINPTGASTVVYNFMLKR
jgi:hypothetical protein